jgi:hypothetical protein
MTTCHECNDTGERDSGGTHPWGEPVYLPCDCKDAEIGRRWREDSSLKKWFPLTAERLAALEAENAALKREAHTWWTAARDTATDAGTLRKALREVLQSDVGRATLQKLADGQGTNTDEGRAWAAAESALGPNSLVT